MKEDLYMRRCLDLAVEGAGNVAPNPMVGSVIVCQDVIIGEGYHQGYGSAHAEANAIESVTDKDVLKKSTLYVNLEPCAHHGKTPPCANLIHHSGIPEVVIGAVDTNRLVGGQGISYLKKNGIHVRQGVLESECRLLNQFHYTYHEKKRPYVILKWAQSADGFIDRDRSLTPSTGPNWITNHACRMLVHKWRSEVQAIMAGTNTLLIDDPALTVREWPGKSPLRVVADRRGRLSESLKVCSPGVPTLVFTTHRKADHDHIEYVALDPQRAGLTEILDHLYHRRIQSLFVEGGARLFNGFISAGIWDEARVFTGGTVFEGGIKAPTLPLPAHHSTRFSGYRLDVFHNQASQTVSQ